MGRVYSTLTGFSMCVHHFFFRYSNWRGPVWVVANAVAAYGLATHGFKDQALDLAHRTTAALADDLRATGTWHECFDSSDRGSGEVCGLEERKRGLRIRFCFRVDSCCCCCSFDLGHSIIERCTAPVSFVIAVVGSCFCFVYVPYMSPGTCCRRILILEHPRLSAYHGPSDGRRPVCNRLNRIRA
jgi:hypothetical protein